MTELLTAAQMRAIERAAIESGEVTGLELMERAGRGTVEAILAEWPELAEGERRAVVLCGPGNNGGDGFVVARFLRERGWGVKVFLYGDPERLPPDARVNLELWAGPDDRGQQVGDLDVFLRGGRDSTEFDVVVDAVFGIGLKRAMGPPLSALDGLVDMSKRESGGPFNVAIDIPSGLESDSGKRLGEDGNVFFAALTVAFHAAKVGHLLGEGPKCCGKLVVCDIGLPSMVTLSLRRLESLVSHDTNKASNWVLYPPRRGPADYEYGPPTTLASPYNVTKERGHKYDHGHALVLSGGVGRGGAARMAARGALRIGAGLVTLACPPAALLENASRVDAIMTRAVRGAEGLAEMLSDERINAVALGPGLGTGDEAAALVCAVLTASGPRGTGDKRGRRAVLDADALTLLARDPDLLALLHDRCVLTPHAGEFARLFPDIAERLAAPAETGPAYSKVDATRDAAARAGCVVLHKGPDTVIAHPGGRAAINSAHYERSAPWLATAGAGDVLTGFIAGLLARGLEPMQAAEAAAWLHVECALEFGPGLIAEDLPEQLPAVFRRLGV